jgi:glycine cleavage system H protein
MSDAVPAHDPAAASAPSAGLRYKRSRFTTRLPTAYRYTAAHMWLADEGAGTWRVGFTKFAVRMLGEVVESGFEVAPGAAVEVGQVIGWLEGFKASTDLYCPLDGGFVGGNPLLDKQADRVHGDPYGEGWLFRGKGTPEEGAMDVHAYVAVLDAAIDRIQGDRHEEYVEDGS